MVYHVPEREILGPQLPVALEPRWMYRIADLCQRRVLAWWSGRPLVGHHTHVPIYTQACTYWILFPKIQYWWIPLVRVWSTPPDTRPHLCSVHKAQAAARWLQSPEIHWGTVVLPGHESESIRPANPWASARGRRMSNEGWPISLRLRTETRSR